jgi:hypothetical protein
MNPPLLVSRVRHQYEHQEGYHTCHVGYGIAFVGEVIFNQMCCMII